MISGQRAKYYEVLNRSIDRVVRKNCILPNLLLYYLKLKDLVRSL